MSIVYPYDTVPFPYPYPTIPIDYWRVPDYQSPYHVITNDNTTADPPPKKKKKYKRIR